MSERYWISGVQLGVIIGLSEKDSIIREFCEDIIEKQFLGNKEDLDLMIKNNLNSKSNKDINKCKEVNSNGRRK